jgi:hypothetical protein
MTQTQPLSPPQRSGICLDCRTALGNNETCDGGPRHRTTSLRTPEGRERLLAEVWGPPGVRRRLRQMALAGGTGAAAGGLVKGGCETGCAVLECSGAVADFPPLAVIVAAAVLAVGLFLLVAKIVEWRRRRRNRPRPNGALRPPKTPHGSRRRGTVIEGPASLGDLGEGQVLAYGLRLQQSHVLRSDLMLSDGVSSGFSVRLEDGATLQIPAGRLRLEGAGRSADKARVAAYLQQLDPRRATAGDELDPIPHDRATELLVCPGDTVEVVGRLVPAVDTRAAEAGYRQAAPSVLAPEGPFVVRLCG